MDEAVASLLGWRHEDKRHKYMVFMQAGRSAEQSPHLHSHDGSIAQVLARLREKAQLEYSDAAAVNAPDEILFEKEQTVLYWTAEMLQALTYMQDIFNELDRRYESELLLDHLLTMRHKKLFIYFDGLDRWARRKYKSTVFQLTDDTASTGKAIAWSGQAAQDDSSGIHPTAQLKPKNDDALQIDGWKTVKADDVLTFIAFLIEEYCKIGPPKIIKGDKPNASEIGRHFEKLATAANNKNELYGLDFETIRKVVAAAQKAKIEKLKPKPEGLS